MGEKTKRWLFPVLVIVFFMIVALLTTTKSEGLLLKGTLVTLGAGSLFLTYVEPYLNRNRQGARAFIFLFQSLLILIIFVAL